MAASGLQRDFDWRGAAAAGAAGWASSQWHSFQGADPGSTQRFANHMTHGMVYGTAHSAVLRGHQPDWGRLAAESFGASLGHAAASQLQQQDALRGASI